ncbi:hypothetical protein FRC00_003662 [Tulasnella sp. 408]|nr:hypothetical protein FRC00_003662 [Tulasnella sp. 408]
MNSIASAGRPKLPATDPPQGGTPEATGESDNHHPLDVESDDEYEVSVEAAKQELEGIQTKGSALIINAEIGFINWPVMHVLKHGYFNERDVNEEAVAKLTTAVQAFDCRWDHPICAAVDKAELAKLGIQPSKGPRGAPALTPEQLAALTIVAIAGQHRQRSGQDILTTAQKNLATSIEALQKLKLQSNDNTAAVEGNPTVSTGVSNAEQGDSTMDGGHRSEEVASGAGDSDIQSLENGMGEHVLGVPELEKLIAKQQQDVHTRTYWPMRLVDKGQLPANSMDPAVLSALMSLSSNKALQQNTGAPYEAWFLAQPILNTPQIAMRTRVGLAVLEMTGASVDLMKHGPMRRLIYTILTIPALRSEFNPSEWKPILALPVATLVIFILQASLNTLLKVFKPDDISKDILAILDRAYQDSLQVMWCSLVCDLESSDASAPLSMYIEKVKERLPNSKSLTEERRQSMDAARTTVEAVVKKAKGPLFSKLLKKDTMKHVPKVADAFVWAERYFSPDAAIYGSFTHAKKQNKRPDPAFAVVHELLYKDPRWLSERQDADLILPQLIALVFNCGREASNVITEHMDKQDPNEIKVVESCVYTSFFQLLSTAAGESRFSSTTAADSEVERPKEQVKGQMDGVPKVIDAISSVGAAKRLLDIIIKAKNGEQRMRLASRLIHFIWTSSANNDKILGYTAVVKFVRGLMGIGVNGQDTPCLISDRIPPINKEGLKAFQISSVDDDIWDNLEKPLKISGGGMSKVFALLPGNKVEEGQRLWKELVEYVREGHKAGLQDQYANMTLPPNPSDGKNYIQIKTVAGAASSTGSKSVKKKGGKGADGSAATKAPNKKGRRADKDLTMTVGKAGEGSTNKDGNNDKAEKRSGDKRKTEDVSDAEGRHDANNGEGKRGRIAT